MSAIKKLESMIRKKQISNYEKIIREIQDYYYNYRVNGDESFGIGSKVDYCLKKGIDGFDYYISDYLTSDFVSKEFSLLINKTQDLITRKKELKNKINKDIKSIEANLQYLLKSFNIAPKQSVVENFEMLYDMYKKNSTQFNYYQQALIFGAGLKFIPEFQKIYEEIKQEIISKTKEGKNIVIATKEVFRDKKIQLNLEEFFNYFNLEKQTMDLEMETETLREEITNQLPDAIIANNFLSISKKIKNKVNYLIESGISEDVALKSVLPEAYGLVKAVCRYSLGQTAYDVQLMGAIAMNEGNICEMYTGEGKTLTAIFPAYLNALLGKEVDIFTPNDYLAERDSKKNRKVFELLGLRVGCVKTEEQSVEEKKEAYSCDVVYGSSNAFAFDYLNDTTREEFVQRVEKPYFIIVDEADQILINNAQTPYILQKSSGFLSINERKRNEYIIANLEKALEVEKILSESIYLCKNENEFSLITGANSKETKKMGNAYSILLLKESTTGQTKVVLTTKAETVMFSLIMREKVEQLTLKNRDYFLSNEDFVLDVDYTINNEKISLTLSGIEKAVNKTKDFFDLNMEWLTEEQYLIMRKYIDNAVVARHVMQKGMNYQVVFNPEEQREEVVVLQDGRIVQDSKFTDGLHQAIELKEGLGVVLSKHEKLLDDSIATISNRALIARYSKICGMTGTADKTMFSEVYGLDTFEVPKNKEYEYSRGPSFLSPPPKRKDNPTVLCKTKNDRLSLIVEEILTSYEKRQPVLVVSNNEEEAKYLSLVLQNLPSPYNNINPQLLVSGKTLEEEAMIIREAGKLGSVTIATEMAGRGTDIKLGGEIETDLERNIQEIIEFDAVQLKLEKILESIDYDGVITTEKINYTKNLIIETVNEDPSFLQDEISELEERYSKDKSYKDKVNYLANKRIETKKKRVYSTGGLKYIQTTPFRTSRNDNQGKGRVGRQGEPGETIMYFSLEEANDVGITDKKTKGTLSNLLQDRLYITDDEAKGVISEIIETAQSETEFNIDVSIAMNDANDLAMSSIGQTLLRNRKQILTTDKIDVMVDNMIYSTIDLLIKDNVPPKKQKKVDKNRTKLSRIKLDTTSLNSSLYNIFGLKIDFDSAYEECSDVVELKLFIYDKIMEKKEELNLGISSDVIDSRDRKSILKSLNETYIMFMEESKNIELQIMNDRIANNPDHNRVLEFQALYNNCRKQGWYSCMKSIFKPGIVKKEEIPEMDETIQKLISELKEQSNYKELYSFDEIVKTR